VIKRALLAAALLASSPALAFNESPPDGSVGTSTLQDGSVTAPKLAPFAAAVNLGWPSATYSLSGNTTLIPTVVGPLTSGDCVAVGASGNLIDALAPCGSGGGGGSGTVTSATAGNLGFYAADGTTISGLGVNPGVLGLLNVATNTANALLQLDASARVRAAQFPALSGDVTTSAGSLTTAIANAAVTSAKLATGAAAANLGPNSVSNSKLANSSTTVNGVTCSLGGSCTVAGGGGGSGTVNSGTGGYLGYYSSTGTVISGTPAGTNVVAAINSAVNSANGLLRLDGGAHIPNTLLTPGAASANLGYTPLDAAATTLPANFLSSSLTSVGTLTSLSVSGNITNAAFPGLSASVYTLGLPGLDMSACSTAATCGWSIFSAPPNYPAADTSTLRLDRVAPATGGLPDHTYSVLGARTTTSLNDAGSQWGVKSELFNRTLFSTGAQNVALSGSAFKQLNGQPPGTQIGPTWAGYLECQDQTGNVDPGASCIGLEIDTYALVGAGTDSSGQRVAMQLQGGVVGGTDTGVHIGYLLAMGTANGAVIDNAINLVQSGSGTPVFNVRGDGSTTISSNLGAWSTFNYGKQLIIQTKTVGGDNPGIGISDLNLTNYVALTNSAGTFTVARMPALSNSATTPTIMFSINPAGMSIPVLPTSSPGSGGGYVCADSSGDLYRKASCP
jgi:hypothetical protein